MSLENQNTGLGLNRLLNTVAAAEYLGLGASTLNRWRCEGRGPEFTVLGGNAVRYRKADLDAFIEAGRRQSTSEVDA